MGEGARGAFSGEFRAFGGSLAAIMMACYISRMVNPWPPLHSFGEGSQADPLTSEQWLALDEDVAGEWVDGRLEEEEVPDAVHELAVSWLIGVLRIWLGGEGFVFGSELKVLTSEDRGRKPDVTIFLPGGSPPPRRGPLRSPPDIIIEVVTPSPKDERRDRIEKMAEYAALGVPFYWLVDPALGSIEMFERTPQAHYQKLVGAVSGVIDSVPGCEGLRLDVDGLWQELSRLGDEGDGS